MRRIGSTSIELENGRNIHLNNILFVPGLHKNLLSISSLEYKGDGVAFIDGMTVVWSKISSIENARVIGIREGRLYRLISPLAQVLVHIEISVYELWHRMFRHLHFKILPTLCSIVNGIPELKEDHVRDVHWVRIPRDHLEAVLHGQNKSWISFTPMYVYDS